MTRDKSLLYRIILALSCIGASAQQGWDVAVHETWLENINESYSLNARLETGSEIGLRHLLQSGYSIRFRLDLQFMRTRNWLPDKEVGKVIWSPQVSYNSLLNRYTFSEGNTVEEFTGLLDALARAETFRTEPESQSVLRFIFRRPDTYVLARYEMLIDHLPQPLQVSLITGEWDISSGWRRFETEIRQ